MKKGFATSAILYTMLLLFLVLMTGILNNLQNKKTILDALKKDTVSALEQDTVIDAILDQIGMINTNFVDLEKRVTNLENNTYNKEEIDSMFDTQKIKIGIQIPPTGTQEMLDEHLKIENYSDKTCTKEWVVLGRNGLTLGGGNWLVETCRTGPNYAYQIARRYGDGKVDTLERSLLGGTWSSWRNPHTPVRDDFITTGLTSPSYVNIIRGGYANNGKIVVGNFLIHVSSTVPRVSNFINGVPQPYMAYSGTVQITSYCTAETTSGYIANGQIYTSSDLAPCDQGGVSYGVSITYLAAS